MDDFVSAENQDTTDVEDQAERLNSKWSTVKNALTERKLQIDYLLAKKQLNSEIGSMNNTLSVRKYRSNAYRTQKLFH